MFGFDTVLFGVMDQSISDSDDDDIVGDNDDVVENLRVTSMKTTMFMLLTNLMVTRTKGKTSIVVQLLRLLVRFIAQLKQDAPMKSCYGQL